MNKWIHDSIGNNKTLPFANAPGQVSPLHCGLYTLLNVRYQNLGMTGMITLNDVTWNDDRMAEDMNIASSVFVIYVLYVCVVVARRATAGHLAQEPNFFVWDWELLGTKSDWHANLFFWHREFLWQYYGVILMVFETWHFLRKNWP